MDMWESRPAESMSKYAYYTGIFPYLLQTFREVIQRVNNAVVINDLVCIHRVVTSASAQNEVNEFRQRSSCILVKRFQEIFDGTLKCCRGV